MHFGVCTPGATYTTSLHAIVSNEQYKIDISIAIHIYWCPHCLYHILHKEVVAAGVDAGEAGPFPSEQEPVTVEWDRDAMADEEGHDTTAGQCGGVIDEEDGEIGEHLSCVAKLSIVDLPRCKQHRHCDVGEALQVAHLVAHVRCGERQGLHPLTGP
jgi:hypothetical protein